MASCPRAAQRNLIRKYNIHFDDPIEQPLDGSQASGWPVARRILVEHIHKLGMEQYERYHRSISCDAAHRPWREHIRQRARRTAALASFCRSNRKNEAGWRFTVETAVMARMSVEVSWYVAVDLFYDTNREACRLTPYPKPDMSWTAVAI